MNKSSLTTEQWAKIAQRLKDREDREAATYPLTKAMHEENPSQDYVQRLGQARDMVNSCGIENLDQIIALVRQGKMVDEIINALKENNDGLGERMGQLTMAFENDFKNRQTIDHESGAYLTYEGGVAAERGLERFAFHWKGEKMDFYARERPNKPGDHSWNPNLHWTFFQVKIPDHMQDQQEEIITMIRQALETHGFGYSHRGYDTVTAEYYSPKI